MEPGMDLTAELELDLATTDTTDLHDPAQRRAVERALAQIEGVHSARIVPGFGRAVDELHVVASPDRDIKPLIRDLQSLLMARYGIPTDHRVISVVQLDERDRVATEPRVVMAQVTVTHQGPAVSAEVTVVSGDSELRGHAEGPASAAGRRRAVARAALDALRPLLGSDRAVEIEAVEVAPAGGHEVALCLVHLHARGGEPASVGSALVTRDESDAIARAVLDALNRVLVHRDGS